MLKQLRHSMRVLRKTPGSTLVAVASLAIGIGTASATFSIADALLLRPLPVLEPSRVVTILPADAGAFGANSSISYPDYRDFRDGNRSFEGLTASSFTNLSFSLDANEIPKVTWGLFASGNFFSTMGIQPALGRAFLESEDQAVGRDPVVVLGYDFWVTYFNRSPSAVGSTIRLNGVECRIIGVAPEQFTGVNQLLKPSLFVPLAMSPRLQGHDALERRDIQWLTLKGRLKSGVSVAQANTDVAAIATRLERLYPRTNHGRGVQVQTEMQLRVTQAPPNVALAAMQSVLAICVLLVACANVAGLLLSRARARSREMAVRLAVGAGRGILIRQLLLENFLLAIMGGLAGVWLAYANTAYFNAIPIPSDIPIAIKAIVDQRALLFTLAVAVLSTFLFGLTPALQTTRVDLVTSLKSGDADIGRRRFWGRNLIVIGQVALSLVILVVSAVIWQGFRDQLAQGPGYRTDGLYLTGFDTQPIHYSQEQSRKFYKELLDRTRSAPGVRSAALASDVPLGFNQSNLTVVPEGYSLPPGQQAFNTLNYYVSDGYFATMGIPILKGRGFLESDGADQPLVAVVNSHFADHYWPRQDALGKRFHLGTDKGPLVEVVGIVETGKYVWIAEPPLDFVYLPHTQHPRSALMVVAESVAPDAATLAPVLRQIAQELDSSMPFSDARTMRDFFNQRAVKTTNILVQAVSVIGLLSLMLAMVGLYALVAYSLSRRSREIGIRMAIGADRHKVVRMVLRQGLALGSLGVGVGLMLSYFACQALTSAVWILGSHLNYALLPAVALPLLLVSVVATYAPARRASRIDPLRALREE
jgi:predicted permease